VKPALPFFVSRMTGQAGFRLEANDMHLRQVARTADLDVARAMHGSFSQVGVVF
jgi:hypothetical protein